MAISQIKVKYLPSAKTNLFEMAQTKKLILKAKAYIDA